MLTVYQNHHNIFYTEWEYLFTRSLDMTFDLILKYKCHDQIVLCCVHYSLPSGQSWKLLLHLPHKLIWQLSTFSAVFNSKHSLISEIWPQAINCDLILSCFQITALSEIWPQAMATCSQSDVWCYSNMTLLSNMCEFEVLESKIWYLSLYIDCIFLRRSVIAQVPP